MGSLADRLIDTLGLVLIALASAWIAWGPRLDSDIWMGWPLLGLLVLVSRRSRCGGGARPLRQPAGAVRKTDASAREADPFSGRAGAKSRAACCCAWPFRWRSNACSWESTSPSPRRPMSRRPSQPGSSPGPPRRSSPSRRSALAGWAFARRAWRLCSVPFGADPAQVVAIGLVWQSVLYVSGLIGFLVQLQPTRCREAYNGAFVRSR